jgi:hypothetical protein
MVVGFSALDALDLTTYTGATAQWQAITDSLDADITSYQKSVTQPVEGGTWTGSAATAAKKSVDSSYQQMVDTRKYSDGVRALVSAAGIGFTAAKKRCLQGVSLAAANMIPVDASGRITPDVAITMAVKDWLNPVILAGMTAQSMIYQGLRMADAVDEEIVPMLSYANKFGQHDSGPWQQHANQDNKNDNAQPNAINGTVNAVLVDQPQWFDTHAQPYKIASASAKDWAFYELCRNVGVPGVTLHMGIHAGWAFSQWLDNTGMPMPVNPQHVLNDVPKFQNQVNDAILGDGNYFFDTGWTNTSVVDDTTNLAQSEDWYWTMDNFRYRVCGRGYVTGGQLNVDYSVGLLEPYVFGTSTAGPPGHTTTSLTRGKLHVGPATFDQADLEHLHTTGLAQNFIIQGVTHFHSTYPQSGNVNPTTTVTESDPWPTL